MALDGKPLPVAAVPRRSAPPAAHRATTHTTAVAPVPVHRSRHHSTARRTRHPARAVTAAPPATAAATDRLAADAGVLTALSLAFVGGS